MAKDKESVVDALAQDEESGAVRPISEEKLRRREKEKLDLLASLASADFSAMKTKVAFLLNLYPQARNSDVTLALKFWETFQPDVYKSHGILPKDLFRLERFHYLVRARAKIQNEYGLFQADDAIRGHRRDREEEMHEAVIQDVAPRRVAFIYADETGKTQEFVSVAAVWVLTGYAVYAVGRAIEEWKSTSPWVKREIHFAKLGKNDIDPAAGYIQIIQNNREFLSFKVIAVEKTRTKRPIEEVVLKLHEHMLLRGAEHEIGTGRIDLPRDIEMTIDEEQSLDSFTLSEMQRRVSDEYKRKFGDGASLTSVQTAASRNSPLLQLADMIAGAVNRRQNQRGDRNFKDEIADMIIERLDLQLKEDEVEGLDATVLFRV